MIHFPLIVIMWFPPVGVFWLVPQKNHNASVDDADDNIIPNVLRH